MTSIVIPISTPGANESAAELLRAAAAVVQVAKGMDQERAASIAATQARREATSAAKALAQAEKEAAREALTTSRLIAQSDRERIQTINVISQKLKAETSAAHKAAHDAAEYELRDIISERAKIVGGSDSKQKGGHGSGGFVSGIRRHAGLVTGALSGGAPDIGSVASGLIAGGGVAAVAAGAAVIGFSVAAVASAMKHAEEAAKTIAESMRHAAEFIADAKHVAGNEGGAAMDSNGSLLIAAQSRNPGALASARKSVMSMPGVTDRDALSFEKQGLSQAQKQAASMAAAISGGSAGDYGEKLRSGHVNMADPNQMASYLLSMEGRFMTPGATGAAFAASQEGAGDINERTRNKATSALDALTPGSQKAGASEGRYDRMQSSLRRNSSLNARVSLNKSVQSERVKLQEAQESESNYLRVFRDVGDFFGAGSGSAETQLRRFDQSHLFGENIGSKIVIGNGNKN